MLNVHNRTTGERLNNRGLFGSAASRKHFISENSMATQLRLAKFSWTNHKSGTMSFGQMGPKWRCLSQSLFVIMHSTMFGKNQTQHICANISFQLSSTVVEG